MGIGVLGLRVGVEGLGDCGLGFRASGALYRVVLKAWGVAASGLRVFGLLAY